MCLISWFSHLVSLKLKPHRLIENKPYVPLWLTRKTLDTFYLVLGTLYIVLGTSFIPYSFLIIKFL